MLSRRELLRLGISATLCNAGSEAKSMLPERSQAIICRSVGGTPRQNMEKVVEGMGGIAKLIGPDDLVLIKPNAQWWNQGAPNLAALKCFVDLVMNRPGGFKGEVVLAENCHRGRSPWNAGAWAHTFERNSDIEGVRNLTDLCRAIKRQYGDRFTVRHWIDVDAGGRRVYRRQDGEGYAYCDGTGGLPLLECKNGLSGRNRRITIMTYPIFRTDRGTVVDLKAGPMRMVNFAALNHHSTYCGATSAIKNYLGVVDLSGGHDPAKGGRLTGDYCNFHSFPFNGWDHGPQPGMLGKAVAGFMRTVRKADLNITTAEWVGLASRTDAPVAHTRTVIASTDPVALDYHAFRYVLHPNSGIGMHDPDNRNSPVRQYLDECSWHGGGVLQAQVRSWDCRGQRMQRDDELAVSGDRLWGTSPQAIMKYLLFRSGIV